MSRHLIHVAPSAEHPHADGFHQLRYRVYVLGKKKKEPENPFQRESDPNDERSIFFTGIGEDGFIVVGCRLISFSSTAPLPIAIKFPDLPLEAGVDEVSRLIAPRFKHRVLSMALYESLCVHAYEQGTEVLYAYVERAYAVYLKRLFSDDMIGTFEGHEKPREVKTGSGTLMPHLPVKIYVRKWRRHFPSKFSESRVRNPRDRLTERCLLAYS